MTTYQASTLRRAWLAVALGAIVLAAASLAAAAEVPAAAGAAAQWREQTLKFTYDGITTLYTCDGLEDKVRDILLVFGARKDLKVRASGCDRGVNLPSRFAWVEATYTSLVPATDTQGKATATIKSVWAPIVISPNRPNFMGAGECELIEQMRDALAKGFTLRNLQYRAACTPHQVSLAGYAVTAEALKADTHTE
jgi:hypothetical protein